MMAQRENAGGNLKGRLHGQQSHVPGDKVGTIAKYRPILRRLKKLKLKGVMAMCVLNHVSLVRLFVASWTVACQAPLSPGLSRQDYWSGLPFPSPGDLPDPGIEPMSLESPALAGGFFTTSATMANGLNECWPPGSGGQVYHVHATSVYLLCQQEPLKTHRAE